METSCATARESSSLGTASELWNPYTNIKEGRKALNLPVSPPSYNHWFDGMALLHQFRMRGGAVTYTSRFLRSDAYKKNSEQDRIVMSEFGTLALPDPCKNFFQRFLSRFEMIGEQMKCCLRSH